ncbi:hypothetical protein IC235_02340 [Hymenobacter sp. BT664]|uniref:Uncharacterized protein n=1 Tax=Hymenobacter montanus TaxID=2771359 RepID=A0A927BAU2_9BACT|nr:hypothetical protein [Hymenobacter montanus]MBD2766728.1 hypothetical protein [Hymenobacter montanus]
MDVVRGIHREGQEGYKIYSDAFDVSNEEINACLEYCASLECKKKVDGDRFCDCCVLDEEPGIDYNDIAEITLSAGSTVVQLGLNSVFLGSLDEYWESEEKIKGWLIAQEIIFGNLDKFK